MISSEDINSTFLLQSGLYVKNNVPEEEIQKGKGGKEAR